MCLVKDLLIKAAFIYRIRNQEYSKTLFQISPNLFLNTFFLTKYRPMQGNLDSGIGEIFAN